MSEIISNRYQIIKLIGRGGMADVYLCLDTILNREVAVKVLKADLSSDEVALERFNREALASTKLSHPNIVDVYDVGEDNDRHYIVMEYIKGFTLKQFIRKRGAIPYKETIWIAKQLVGALMEAHRNGIIHRDIKSQNVLIKADGTIKITDFGIAIAHGAMQITSKDSVLGSVHYLAPELTKGAHASMQSDIYSLGIVLYEMLTGDVPYKGDTAVQVALQHIKGELKSVRSFDPTIPQSVENIIIKATAKNVENRYKNTAFLLRDLNECLNPDHLYDEKIDINADLESKASSSMKVSKQEQEASKQNIKPKDNDEGSLFLKIFLISVSILSAFILFAVLYLTGKLNFKKGDIVIPQIVSLTVQEASDLLISNNLELDTSNIEWVLTDDAVKGKIISCSPAQGTQVEVGTKVKVSVCKGNYEVMGNYTGKNYLDAGKYLDKLDFSVKYEAVESEEDGGIVVDQSIKDGEKYDPSIRNNITLYYSKLDRFLIPLDKKGESLDSFVSFLQDSDIKYELVKKDKDYFKHGDLEGCLANSVVLTEPMFGVEYLIDDYDTVLIYYYE